MSPFRLLTIVRWLTFAIYLLTAVACCSTLWVDVSWAEAAAKEDVPQQEKSPQQEKAAEEKPQEENAPASKQAIVLKKKAPLHELPVLKPKQLSVPARLLVPEAVAKTPAGKKPAKKKAMQPAARQPNAPFWLRRRGTLSPATTYRLESMSRNAQLSPAMQFHLHRSGASISVPPDARSSGAAAATAAGQGTPKYYPGISRLPTQKPFVGVEHPPSTIERYWPLLLEGRQDPESGVIIWTLP